MLPYQCTTLAMYASRFPRVNATNVIVIAIDAGAMDEEVRIMNFRQLPSTALRSSPSCLLPFRHSLLSF